MDEILDIIAHKVYGIQENKEYVNMNRYFSIVRKAMTIDRILKIEDEKERMHISDAEYHYEVCRNILDFGGDHKERNKYLDQLTSLKNMLKPYNLPVTEKDAEEELLRRVSTIHMDAQKSR